MFPFRTIWTGLAAAALSLAATSCGGRSATQPSVTVPSTAPATRAAAAPLLVYASKDSGFVLNYPPSWQPHPGDVELTLTPVGYSGSYRAITFDVPWVPPHLPGMVTIDRVTMGFIDDLRKRMQGAVVQSNVPDTLAGARARRIEATASLNGKPMVISALVAIHHETVYILSAETDSAGADDARAALQTVLATWKWSGR